MPDIASRPTLCFRFIAGTLILMFLLHYPLSAVGEQSGGISLKLGKLEGHTTYDIGGKITTPSGSGYLWNPISRLEFPLDNTTIEAKYTHPIDTYTELQGSLGTTFLSGNAGKMKDSDWGYWYAYYNGGCCDYNSKDIYSESDAKLESGLLADLSILHSPANNLYIGIGYKYQKFVYEIRDLHQWYPSYKRYFGVDATHDYVNGKVLEYEVTYKMPYFALQYRYAFSPDLSISLTGKHSPMVTAEDYDNHVLRSKKSYGTCEGTASFYNLQLLYRIIETTRLGVFYDVKDIDTSGSQKQYTNGSWTATINQDIYSDQTSYGISLTIGF